MIDPGRPLGVLGAGSWGTALAIHLAADGGEVRMWGRSPELCRQLARDRVNERYLPGVGFPDSLQVIEELVELAPCQVVLVVVPSHGFREVLHRFLGIAHGPEPVILISGTKGMEIDTLARMSQVCFEEATAASREARFAVISGPSFAVELATGTPTASVVASEDAALAVAIQERFSHGPLRLYTSSDVVGVEIGGSAKNVIAIAAGTAAGLGFGHNTLAALMTRGLHEVTRLGIACGGRPRTFSGLAGMGDLVLTCTGGPSRNRQTGLDLAAGRTLEEIGAARRTVAEGVRSSRALVRLAQRKGVEMPISEQMVEVLYAGKSPRQAVEELMSRDLKAEAEL